MAYQVAAGGNTGYNPATNLAGLIKQYSQDPDWLINALGDPYGGGGMYGSTGRGPMLGPNHPWVNQYMERTRGGRQGMLDQIPGIPANIRGGRVRGQEWSPYKEAIQASAGKYGEDFERAMNWAANMSKFGVDWGLGQQRNLGNIYGSRLDFLKSALNTERGYTQDKEGRRRWDTEWQNRMAQQARDWGYQDKQRLWEEQDRAKQQQQAMIAQGQQQQREHELKGLSGMYGIGASGTHGGVPWGQSVLSKNMLEGTVSSPGVKGPVVNYRPKRQVTRSYGTGTGAKRYNTWA